MCVNGKLVYARARYVEGEKRTSTTSERGKTVKGKATRRETTGINEKEREREREKRG